MVIRFDGGPHFGAADYDAAYFAGQLARYQRGIYRRRERWVARWLPERLAGVVLDAGCGAGLFSAAALARGARVIALDFSAQALSATRERAAPSLGVRADLEDLPLAAASIDYALVLDVLEHLYRPERLCAELARVLRSGASALVLTDNAASPSRIKGLRRLAQALRWCAAGGRELARVRAHHRAPSCHVALYDAGEIRALLAGAGLEVLRLATFPRHGGALLARLARAWPSPDHRGGALIAEVRKP